MIKEVLSGSCRYVHVWAAVILMSISAAQASNTIDVPNLIYNDLITPGIAGHYITNGRHQGQDTVVVATVDNNGNVVRWIAVNQMSVPVAAGGQDEDGGVPLQDFIEQNQLSFFGGGSCATFVVCNDLFGQMTQGYGNLGLIE
ncbi:MAG: hypothetical protein AAF229_06810 [Pseudomonadota bacterium]